MEKLNPTLLLAAFIAFCANSALAQGTLLYTWHDSEGPNNRFQASFEIYDFEQVPGTWFAGTHLFDQTLTVTSPDHTWAPGTCGGYASGFTGPGGSLYLDAICSDPAFPSVRADVNAVSIVEYNYAGGTPGSIRLTENGFWTFAPVPEPSFPAFLVLGLLALVSKKAISRK